MKKISALLYTGALLVVASFLTPNVGASEYYGKIAFVKYSAGSIANIYTTNSDGTGLEKITNNTVAYAVFNNISFSPDGSKILYAYDVYDLDGDDSEIYQINSDGTNVTALTNNSIDDEYPSYSPDGTKIGFVSNRDGRDEVYTMNVDGSSQTRVTTTGGSSAYDYTDLSYSPSGSKFLYLYNVHADDTNDGIYTMNVNGSSQAKITTATVASAPKFSPDGNKITYTILNNGYHIYRINTDGSGEVQLTANGDGYDDYPSYSVDGTKIAFISDRDIPAGPGKGADGWLYTMNADGTNVQKLTSYSVMSPVFSPVHSSVSSQTPAPDGGNSTLVVDEDLSGQNYTITNQTLVIEKNGRVGTVTVGAGAILKGLGVLGALTVQQGGHLAPGKSPGCLTVNGATILNGAFDVELGGTVACTSYDQLIANGTVNLTGATLNLARVNNFTPKVGDSFTIINNDSNDGVTGTFTNLAEGALVTSDGVVYAISYVGGSGNDVTLTVRSIPSVPNTGTELLMANPLVSLGATVLFAGAVLYIHRMRSVRS